jgi:DNA-directed RNA polymerase subunit omega
MIKPIADLILSPEQSRYSLVIAIAKRARQIAEDAEKNKVILDDKPVQMAVEEYQSHKIRMIEKVSENDDDEE